MSFIYRMSTKLPVLKIAYEIRNEKKKVTSEIKDIKKKRIERQNTIK